MEDSTHPRVLVFSLIIGTILLFMVVGAFLQSKNRESAIVLPGGITYLGPTPTPMPSTPNTQIQVGKIPVQSHESWTEKKGAVFPYSFQYPTSLSLGVFPNDPYDSVTVFHANTDSNANIFFRVENLTTLKKQQYIGKTKEYANDWWKDYAWKNVSSVTTFTNSHGLAGYRAAYTNDEGTIPYEHVFFEVPGNNNLVIWVSGKLFSDDVFSKLVDSVSWTQK